MWQIDALEFPNNFAKMISQCDAIWLSHGEALTMQMFVAPWPCMAILSSPVKAMAVVMPTLQGALAKGCCCTAKSAQHSCPLRFSGSALNQAVLSKHFAACAQHHAIQALDLCMCANADSGY